MSIVGNRFSWISDNSSMTANGTLTCNNIKATNGTFTGTIEGSDISGSTIDVGAFYAEDGFVQFGNFVVYTDEQYSLKSTDGEIDIYTTGSPTGGNVAGLKVGTVTLYGGNIFCGDVRCDRVLADNGENLNSRFYEIYLGKSWWGGDGVTEAVQTLWEEVFNSSDARMKNNIWDIDSQEAIEFILGSHPVTFQYNRDGKWSMGFIAQEVDALQEEMEIYYPLVRTDSKNEKYYINYSGYTPLLVAAIQNLQEQINMLKNGGEDADEIH